MLDIGFSELLVVGGVALVVLGPEKLAVVARSTGKWAGKAQRYVNDVKADIAREGELAELRKLKAELETTGQDIGASLRTTAADVQHDLTALENGVKSGVNSNLESGVKDDVKVDLKSQFNVDASLSTNTVMLDDAQSQAAIQASLDSVDMNGTYQSSLDSTLSMPLSTPPLNDPIAMRMEYEALQDDLVQLENRMVQLKNDIETGLHTV